MRQHAGTHCCDAIAGSSSVAHLCLCHATRSAAASIVCPRQSAQPSSSLSCFPAQHQQAALPASHAPLSSPAHASSISPFPSTPPRPHHASTVPAHSPSILAGTMTGLSLKPLRPLSRATRLDVLPYEPRPAAIAAAKTGASPAAQQAVLPASSSPVTPLFIHPALLCLHPAMTHASPSISLLVWNCQTLSDTHLSMLEVHLASSRPAPSIILLQEALVVVSHGRASDRLPAPPAPRLPGYTWIAVPHPTYHSASRPDAELSTLGFFVSDLLYNHTHPYATCKHRPDLSPTHLSSIAAAVPPSPVPIPPAALSTQSNLSFLQLDLPHSPILIGNMYCSPSATSSDRLLLRLSIRAGTRLLPSRADLW